MMLVLLPALTIPLLSSATSMAQVLKLEAKQIESTKQHEFITLQGYVAEREKYISAPYSGYVKSIHMENGQWVGEGETLVILLNRELNHKIRDTEISNSAALIAERNARKTYKRAKALMAKGVISKEDYDRLFLAWKTKRLSYLQKSERLRHLMNKKSELNIVSSGNLVVVQQLAAYGEWVNKGQPLLKVYDPAAVILSVSMKESTYRKLRQSQRVIIKLNNTNPITIGLDHLHLVPSISKKTQMMTVNVNLGDKFPLDFLFPGKRVDIRFGVKLTEDRIAVPSDAVIKKDGDFFVWKVRSDDTNKAVMIPVEVVRYYQDQAILVKSPLFDIDDYLVVRGNDYLMPSMQTEIKLTSSLS